MPFLEAGVGLIRMVSTRTGLRIAVRERVIVTGHPAMLSFEVGAYSSRPRARSARRKSCSVRVVSEDWSGRRGSNPRHQAWEACVLPLNYSRAPVTCYSSPRAVRGGAHRSPLAPRATPPRSRFQSREAERRGVRSARNHERQRRAGMPRVEELGDVARHLRCRVGFRREIRPDRRVRPDRGQPRDVCERQGIERHVRSGERDGIEGNGPVGTHGDTSGITSGLFACQLPAIGDDGRCAARSQAFIAQRDEAEP
jgi:hypothetical protein